MSQCIRCFKKSILISSPLKVCVDCIRNHYDEVKPHIEKVHTKVREGFDLPAIPPKADGGLLCDLCINQCQIPEGDRGYCGVRFNAGSKFIGGKEDEGNFSYYYDPLPTNCVADWICPAGTECGYPQYSYSKGIEHGYKNLAVFFNSCTYNCLFCQNWHYRRKSTQRGKLLPREIEDRVDDQTSCICYFGGDPTSQMPYALKSSYKAFEANREKILRFCWETNGSMNKRLLGKAAKISLNSGGCIKFDLKAWNEKVHKALCSVSNSWTLANFKRLAKYINKRPDFPFLLASTLLIPGYVDEEEVSRIASFIASLNPDIPYSLLGFHPQFYMQDLPYTSIGHAQRCLHAARDAGLKNVKVGNTHLLGNAY